MIPAMIAEPGLTGETAARTAPLSGDAIDIVESATGINAFSGEKLSGFERALTIGAAALPFVSGGYLRDASKLEVVQQSIKEYGIDSYSRIKQMVKGSDLEVHHIIEKRFSGVDVLGVKQSQIPTVALPKDLHQEITNLWRDAISYGKGTSEASKTLLQGRIQEVYKNYPDLLKQAEGFLGGVK